MGFIFITTSMTSQKTANSYSYGRGWFASFQKLISPKQIMKFLRIFIDDAQKDNAKHFLRRKRAQTNLLEQSFNDKYLEVKSN